MYLSIEHNSSETVITDSRTKVVTVLYGDFLLTYTAHIKIVFHNCVFFPADWIIVPPGNITTQLLLLATIILLIVGYI